MEIQLGKEGVNFCQSWKLEICWKEANNKVYSKEWRRETPWKQVVVSA